MANVEAHAVDITRCTECPYVSEHKQGDRRAACTHPSRMIYDKFTVAWNEAPPVSCPHRAKPTLLRVIAPTRRVH